MRRWISVLDWLPRYRREDLPGDLMAGVTGAAVLVPQSMAYAQIALARLELPTGRRD